MRILEINGFMTWAVSYEGSHEIERWMSRYLFWKEEANGRSRWRGDFLKGISLLSKRPAEPWDLIVCATFGRSYGKNRIYRFIKSLHERIVIFLIRLVKNRIDCPLAVIDISDDQTIHPINKGLLDACDLFFKRELPLDVYHCFDSFRETQTRRSTKKDRDRFAKKGWPQKLRPITLGCREKEPVVTRVPCGKKKWDIFYLGNNDGKPRRNGIDDALNTLRNMGYKVFDENRPLPLDEYLEVMRNSRLALSPPGFGWDCHRHYEASMLGTVAVTPFPVIQRFEPLINGLHCLFYDPEQSLVDQLKAMLDDGELLDRISEDAQAYSMSKHTHRAIFDGMLKRVFE